MWILFTVVLACVDYRATPEMARAIREGCGVVHNGTLCVYDGCFRYPHVVDVGKPAFRTFTDSIANRAIPQYIVIEHKAGENNWERFNITGITAIECLIQRKHAFGLLI